MTSLRELRNLHLLKCMSILCTQTMCISSKFHPRAKATHNISQFVRFYGRKKAADSDLEVKQKAQETLLEYLHSTRNLKFLDAENMSKHSPQFFDTLLRKVEIDDDGDVGRSVARFLRYHPINEFEPFFESIGLNPSEYASFLPRDKMFLADDHFLLQNYYVLCNYGFARNAIGKIYKEAREVFQRDSKFIKSKLQSFEKFGLKKPLVVKIIALSPCLLRGDSNKEFLQSLTVLKNLGVEFNWVEEHIREGDSYNWKYMLELMFLMVKLGLSEVNLRGVITQHPDFLHESSVRVSFHIFAFFLKFGATHNDMKTVFLQFPNISVAKFASNLRRCHKFLVAIRMPIKDIGWLFRDYPLLLGSSDVKEFHSLQCGLSCGRKRLCEIVKDDPSVFKKWVKGIRVERLPERERVSKVKLLRAQVPLTADFFERLKEMEKALRIMKMKAAELEQSFECLLNAGLGHDDGKVMLDKSHGIQPGGNERLHEIAKEDLHMFKENDPEEDVGRSPEEMVLEEGGRSPEEKVPKEEVGRPPKEKVPKEEVGRPAKLTTFSKSRVLKTKFLLSLGYVEGSEEMEKAITMVRGRAENLQERFEIFVDAGMTRDEAAAMMKACPEAINQSKDVIEGKIHCFTKDLGYPISDLVTYARLITYGVERIKLRGLMYEWLKNEGTLIPGLALTSLVRCTEEEFIERYVNCHSRGAEFWERLKKETTF